MTKRDPARPPTHPGLILREDVLPSVGQSKAEIARLLGISRQTFHGILKGEKPVSPDSSVRLGQLFGTSSAHWARMQTAYDIWHSEQRVDLTSIPRLAELSR